MTRFINACLTVILALALVLAPLSAPAVDYSTHRMGKGAGAGALKWNEIYNGLVTAVQNTDNAITSQVSALAAQVLGFVTTEDQLVLITATPTYVDGNTFTVPGNWTANLAAGKSVSLDQGVDKVVGNTIVSSSFAAGVTTVILTNSNLTANLTRVAVFASRSGLWPWGDGGVFTRDYGTGVAALQAALDFIGPLERTLKVYPGTYAFTGKFTFPANVRLHLPPGVIFDTSAIPETAIADLSRANPCVVTWSGHGLETGDAVYFGGITAADWAIIKGLYPVTKINNDTFSIAVNTSTFAAAYNPATDPGVYAPAVHLRSPFEAGPYQIFAASGYNKIFIGEGSAPSVYAEYWGAKADDSTPSVAAIQAALDTGRPVHLLAGTYRCAQQIYFRNNHSFAWLEGAGMTQTALQFSHTTNAGIICDFNNIGLPCAYLGDLTLYGPGSAFVDGNYGFYLPGGAGKGISNLTLERVRFRLWGSDDIRLRGQSGPVNIIDTYLYDCGSNGITIVQDGTGIGTQDVTVRGGAIQGLIAGSAVAIVGSSAVIAGSFSMYDTDIELPATSTQPAVYIKNCYGPLFSGVTIASQATSLSLSDAVVCMDTGSLGAQFINCVTNASGGLNNFHFAGGSNHMISGGFHYNNATPPSGLGWFVQNHSNNLVVTNPGLSTFAANHDVVYDDSAYGLGLTLNGVRAIRQPGTGDEIVFKPPNLWLGKHITWNPGTVASLTSATPLNVTINGASTDSFVMVGPRSGGGAANITGCLFSGYVSAANTVTINLFNATASSKGFTGDIPIDIYIFKPSP